MKAFLKRGHHKSSNNINYNHPDLPLSSPRGTRRSPDPSSQSTEHFGGGYAGDRRSIAVDPSFDPSPYGPDDVAQPSPQFAGGLTRSQTVLRRESARKAEHLTPQPSPQPLWPPDLGQLPSPNEHFEAAPAEYVYEGSAPMSQYQSNTPGKSSSDSGQSTALDRWSQRRLQRLNTEQGFREQRQGGQPGVLSPPLSQESSYSNASGGQYAQDAQPQHQQHQHQPHPSAYQAQRTGPAVQPNAGLGVQTQSVSSSSSRGNNYSQHDAAPPQTYSPPESASQFQQDAPRPPLTQSRSFNSQQEDSMSSNNGSVPATKTSRSGMNNRQSVHNGISSREGSALGGQGGNHTGVPAYNPNVVPAPEQGYGGNAQQQKSGDGGRGGTPQPNKPMTKEDIEQLISDHAQLREKYTKVKKYYFEKEDQVKTLQNSLAHQRLSQSRTSLDDSEYTTRFNRLDGLVAQLAFSIRKSWRSIPSWLVSSVNKDAVATGKQEMTAAGRAFISCWLVDEVFDKYFHPDLEPTLSAQLKSIQNNIRRFAPMAQTAEEQDYLTSKVVNWRLATLEGLQEALRSPQCPTNRTQLTDMLKEQLVAALSVHLQDPPPSDLEGGVHMIIELVVSIAIHLPLESRDVSIEYFMPGYSILPEQMKVETGIPPLTMSIADDAAERASAKTDVSDITDNADANTLGSESTKKRSMLSALTGSGKKESAQRKHAGAGGSSSSLNRPDSSQGMKQDAPPRVRMSAGIGVQIRGRSVLVKAPVFGTA